MVERRQNGSGAVTATQETNYLFSFPFPVLSPASTGIDLTYLSFESLSDLPLLTRAQLQEKNEAIDGDLLPEARGAVTESMTSGSTGYLMKFRTTALTSTFWNALNMRE